MSLRAILPPTDFIKKMNLVGVIEARLKATGEGMKKDFKKTVSSWDTKVYFQVKLDVVKGTVQVTTRSRIYRFVNEGTKPHIITPKKKKVLRFMSGYSAKTRPGFIGSSGGGSSGSPVFSQVVHHPGVKARNFTKKISVKWAYTFESGMKADIAKAVRGGR